MKRRKRCSQCGKLKPKRDFVAWMNCVYPKFKELERYCKSCADSPTGAERKA